MSSDQRVPFSMHTDDNDSFNWKDIDLYNKRMRTEM